MLQTVIFFYSCKHYLLPLVSETIVYFMTIIGLKVLQFEKKQVLKELHKPAKNVP